MNSQSLFEPLIIAIADAVALRLQGTIGTQKPSARLLTVEAAGAYLSRSGDSVRALISTGKLPVVRLDRRTFLDIRDLDRIIDDSKELAL